MRGDGRRDATPARALPPVEDSRAAPAPFRTEDGVAIPVSGHVVTATKS